MKLLDLKTLHGPNYWSITWHNIIQAKVDIEELEELPTNKIEGFTERLSAAMPSLKSHFCSEGHEGGFLKRVKEGTWMAHVVEHIALELQFLAGMECAFGRTRSSEKKGVYYVAFSYTLPEAGRYAIYAAINIAQHLIDNKNYDISKDVEELKEIKTAKGAGISTEAILTEAQKRDIPFRKINDGSMYILGQGVNQRRISASIACSTSGIGIDTACDKENTKRILNRAYVPVPEGEVINSVEQIKEYITHFGFPLTIKPLDGNHGKGVSVNIQTEEDAISAFNKAAIFSGPVIVERFIEGSDFRLLVIDYKFVAAAKRIPAMVKGNNCSTIRQLVEELNKDPNRGNGHAKVLTQIKIDTNTETVLKKKGLTLDSVPSEGEIIYLKETANLSTGGTSVDVTDIIHPDNILLAERVSRLIDLDICGIDVVTKDITKPLSPDNGSVIEVNACPGLRMHLKPTEGKARNVAEPIVSMLFREGRSSRIPIVAVTGTNGKTTTTRLIAHIAKIAGQTVGYTTTDGIYINDETICHGDCTGSSSTELVLTDPIVDFAVLECARGGILRTGLGFDQCDTSIITNVAEDHLGLDGINSLREMAKIKSVVAESTSKSGYTILNAEDDRVFDMGDYVECNIALFALDHNNERIERHCKRGGLAAIVDDGLVVVKKGNWSTVICAVNEIPLTFSGKAECMTKNVLA
ncbi:MAG: cyanophycin synthetase, partial [Bacteroidia bacterium]